LPKTHFVVQHPGEARGIEPLRKRALLLLSAIVSAFAASQSYAAEPVTSFTVLSPVDVKVYGEMFAAQKVGQNAKVDALAAGLSDKSLMGYVLEERYHGAHYHSKFAELKSWLEEYGDLDRLGAYVATAYLAELKDKQALAVCNRILAKSGIAAQQCHWTAGLASYRVADFDGAAQHFEIVVNTSKVPRTYAAAAFWAAR